MLRQILKFVVNLAGFELRKIPTYSFEDITPNLITAPSPVIFDVGANRGQSIDRYKAFFPQSYIHCFEPSTEEASRLRKIHQNDRSIIINEVAVGATSGVEKFFLNANSAHSSLKKLKTDTEWLEIRSRELKVDKHNYTVSSANVNVTTLDEYCAAHQIDYIDVLKIDTQGFEENVLIGAENLLKNGAISLIQLELTISEIYEEPLTIYDVEKHLVPLGYKLFGSSRAGNLLSDYIYETDHIYVSAKLYETFKDQNQGS